MLKSDGSMKWRWKHEIATLSVAVHDPYRLAETALNALASTGWEICLLHVEPESDSFPYLHIIARKLITDDAP